MGQSSTSDRSDGDQRALKEVRKAAHDVFSSTRMSETHPLLLHRFQEGLAGHLKEMLT